MLRRALSCSELSLKHVLLMFCTSCREYLSMVSRVVAWRGHTVRTVSAQPFYSAHIYCTSAHTNTDIRPQNT